MAGQAARPGGALPGSGEYGVSLGQSALVSWIFLGLVVGGTNLGSGRLGYTLDAVGAGGGGGGWDNYLKTSPKH